MATVNPKRAAATRKRTHEGAPAKDITDFQRLRRSVMSCLLWEREFYEDGEAIADRIADLVGKVGITGAERVAVEARDEMHLRHAPLWVVRGMARMGGGKDSYVIGDTLAHVIQRADELTEFLALYWKDGKQPLSAQVKRGLAEAFGKFDAYQLAKYNRDTAVKLRDVLFLTHPKPKDAEQAEVWKQLVDGTLPAPDTWEVNLSGGKDKRETWVRLIHEGKLGGLAILRNLRNMKDAGVPETLIRQAIEQGRYGRVLPFRFVSAAKAAPAFEDSLDAAMLLTLSQSPKLPGRTVVVVDVSGSMYGQMVSRRSDMDRATAASALGAILREVCEDVAVYATAGNDYTRVHQTERVPARRGMALVDAIHGQCKPLGGGGIFLTPVCRFLREQEGEVDRMVVVTDEQDCAISADDSPNHADPIGRHNYLLNVASYRNGIGYRGKWTHIDGWSEATIKYILAIEGAGQVASGQA
jgi:hypothetical protein